MAGVKRTTKLNTSAMAMRSSDLPSREPVAVSTADWKPQPAAPADSLQRSSPSWASPRLLPDNTAYNKTAIAAISAVANMGPS